MGPVIVPVFKAARGKNCKCANPSLSQESDSPQDRVPQENQGLGFSRLVLTVPTRRLMRSYDQWMTREGRNSWMRMPSLNSHPILTLKSTQLIDFLLELSLSALPLRNKNR